MNNLQPVPTYSLSDLFGDINNGNVNEFNYDGKVFNVKRIGFKWVVTDPITEYTAIPNNSPNCMLDLQGMAACLIAYNKNLIFDKQGNISN